MINRVVLMGRLTADPELKKNASDLSVVSFSVAVDRAYSKDKQETDFINCVAWRQTAEFISRYFSKGRLIALEGRLQTRTWTDRDGNKRYTTEVLVDQVSFTGEKKDDGGYGAPKKAPNVERDDFAAPPAPAQYSQDNYTDVQTDDEEDLPF